MLIFTLIFAGVVGAVIGSFLTVVIDRYPMMPAKHFNLWSPRSHCMHCRTQLKFWQNIPLLSYILLAGQCAVCQQKIAFTCFCVELFSSLLVPIVLLRFGFTLEGLAVVIFSCTLLILSMIDLKNQLLPDIFTLSLLWFGLLVNITNTFTTLSQAVLGAIVGYSSLWLMAHLFKWLYHKEGMGFGDFKMLAMLGAWLGIRALLNILLTATFIALLTSVICILCKKITAKNPIPFGPALAVGGWCTLLFGATLENMVKSMVR